MYDETRPTTTHTLHTMTVQGMLNLQKLQSLASIQQSSMPSLAGLQGLAGLSSAAINLNSPLNLSVGSASNLQTSFQSSVTGSTGALGAGGVGGGGNSSQMPQLILASGQLVQGVQGAQLLIPTSQGKHSNGIFFCSVVNLNCFV